MPEDGVIKFNYDWKKKPFEVEGFAELNSLRDRLYSLKLIGGFENGIGYGNISIRLAKTNQFIISGSGTGAIKVLGKKDYSKVLQFDFEKSWLRCIGLVRASSESLSHAAIYCSDSEANAVIHVHGHEMWNRLLGKVPETGPHADCGSPELAEEIFKLFKEKELREKKIIVTAGHKDGIISFGKDLDEAEGILMKYFKG